jgi:hypothetical protein
VLPFTSGPTRMLSHTPHELPFVQMKLSPTPTKDVRATSKDSLGHGMDAVIMLAIFLGLGFGLDSLFGTTPLFMIILTVIGSVGLFARFYYSYEARMDEHDAERLAKLAGASTTSSTLKTTVAQNGEAA